MKGCDRGRAIKYANISILPIYLFVKCVSHICLKRTGSGLVSVLMLIRLQRCSSKYLKTLEWSLPSHTQLLSREG